MKDSLWNLTLINFLFMTAIDSFWSTIVLHCISCVITNHLDLKYIGILELFEDSTFSMYSQLLELGRFLNFSISVRSLRNDTISILIDF